MCRLRRGYNSKRRPQSPGALKTRQSLSMPPAVWKFPHSCIRIQPMRTASYTVPSQNAAATAASVETAYRALKKRGKVKDNFKFIAFGGDGGTYDIGLQSLSGALERNHDMVYVCYDNEAYMNTGIQRSSSTPRFANATTSPARKCAAGQTAEQEGSSHPSSLHTDPCTLPRLRSSAI